MGQTNGSNEVMIQRLETELRERSTLAQGIIERANAGNRDLDEGERQMLTECRGRMEAIKGQLEDVQDTFKVAYETRNRSAEIGAEIEKLKGTPVTGEIEYRSAGQYISDVCQSYIGVRDASDRLEMFHRAAAHNKTSDVLGVVPKQAVGEVINFRDGSRPLVNLLGPRDLPGARWTRPRVTQHTSVALQGAAGLAADEKTELVSQKLVIGELEGVVKTYGGYVNVSKQTIDFSSPNAFDIIVNDLALQYALETEAATADAIQATGTAAVNVDLTPATGTRQEALAAGIWDAAAQVFAAVKGAGNLVLVMAPGALKLFGPLFAPINQQNGFGSGFSAANFSSGIVGNIAGVTGVMSAGLAGTEAFLLSTAAVEVYEQSIGQLQVLEPSVLGVQVAYAGYFSTMTIEDDAIVPIVAAP